MQAHRLDLIVLFPTIGICAETSWMYWRRKQAEAHLQFFPGGGTHTRHQGWVAKYQMGSGSGVCQICCPFNNLESLPYSSPSSEILPILQVILSFCSTTLAPYHLPLFLIKLLQPMDMAVVQAFNEDFLSFTTQTCTLIGDQTSTSWCISQCSPTEPYQPGTVTFFNPQDIGLLE